MSSNTVGSQELASSRDGAPSTAVQSGAVLGGGQRILRNGSREELRVDRMECEAAVPGARPQILLRERGERKALRIQVTPITLTRGPKITVQLLLSAYLGRIGDCPYP